MSAKRKVTEGNGFTTQVTYHAVEVREACVDTHDFQVQLIANRRGELWAEPTVVITQKTALFPEDIDRLCEALQMARTAFEREWPRNSLDRRLGLR